jgi:hypothetical protein
VCLTWIGKARGAHEGHMSGSHRLTLGQGGQGRPSPQRNFVMRRHGSLPRGLRAQSGASHG